MRAFDGAGDLVGEAYLHNNIGVRKYFAGDWKGAVESYGRSRELKSQAGDVVGEALATNNLAEVLLLQNHFDEAHELFLTAEASWRAANYRVGVAYVTGNLAMVEARSGDVGSGLETLARARQMCEEVGAASLRLEMDVRKVELLLLADRPRDALDDANRIHDQLVIHHSGDDELTAQLLALLAIAHARVGERDEARLIAAEAVGQADAQSNRYVAAIGSLVGAVVGGPDAERLQDRGVELLEQLGVRGRPAILRGLDLPSMESRSDAPSRSSAIVESA